VKFDVLPTDTALPTNITTFLYDRSGHSSPR